ncbi:hypothetical protein [Nitrosophilus kaiyonis]|uniref:hypothetical protein n=1 Tax=Nitrosophilus kaiyonis TaxID=2930200 RepID=UPI00248FA2F1|nr:hypothetical protein [Nitrosophilus kaiyonis]
MKKLIILLLLISFFYADEIKVISPKPYAKISNNKPVSIKITYEAKYTGADECKIAYSNSGNLEITPIDEVLKKINKKITIKLKKSGSINVGKTTETIFIPYNVIKKVIEKGYTNNGFNYKRYFYFGDCLSTDISYGDVFLKIKITTPSALPLHISKIRLFFDNKKAVISVNKNENLKAYAEVEMQGKGLLKAHWEVDGRVLSRIFKHINNKRRITFETPDIPPLPTFEPGTHTVRFIVDEPKPGFEEPTALYFVKTEKLINKNIIKLNPKDKSKLNFEELKFSWQPITGAKLYLIEFFILGEEKPIFSAYTKTNSYEIPKNLLGKVFEKGEYYSWKVVGYDEDDHLIATSNTNRFTIK